MANESSGFPTLSFLFFLINQNGLLVKNKWPLIKIGSRAYYRLSVYRLSVCWIIFEE